MKIAYCGYDFFSASLREILARGHNVYRIFTVPCDNRVDFNQFIYAIGNDYNVPVSEERITNQTIEQLRLESCDVLITAAYFYKIPSLDGSGIRGVNIHPTLLPIGRGEMPLPWTILTDQRLSGITVHKLTQDYDAGDILLQEPFAVDPRERIESVSAKAQLKAKEVLPRVLENFASYWHDARPQAGTISHWDRLTKEQRTLDWNRDVADLDRLCRAVGKFGCFATFDDRDWWVYGLIGWQQPHNYQPGSVVHKTNTETIVAAADGLVSVLYCQPIKRG